MFIGAVQFNPWERIWKSWASGKCKFFLWLATHNKCWTADRLAMRGFAHPEHCPLCDQEEETIDHLLLSCVFSRQIWFYVLEKFGLQALAPQPDEHSFEEWWDQASRRIPVQVSKGLNSIVILVAWSLWNQRYRCVFDGLQPNLSRLLSTMRDEQHV
jgi:hypothetical protein